MKVAIYCRVSDDKKKLDGERRQDVTRQIEALGNFVKLKGITEYETYVDDGKSAFTEDWNSRPAFKKMYDQCLRRNIDIVYIEDMTRFSRNLLMGLQWLKQLGEVGVQVISLKEGELEVTSSKGWMQNSLLLMFAEWESRIRSEKVRSGMAKAKSEGKRIGGRNPTLPAKHKYTKKSECWGVSPK